MKTQDKFTIRSAAVISIVFLLTALTVLAQSGNYIDRFNFGNPTSEFIHDFSPGLTSDGTGLSNQTYRLPIANSQLIFTMGCSATRQTYLTVKFWGNDSTAAYSLAGAPAQYPAIELSGNPTAVFPNRFYYYTIPIPLSWTTNTSVTITLNVGSTTKPIYSVFTHTDPFFALATNDPTGTKPVPTGQAALSTLTVSNVVFLMASERTNIFGSSGYLNSITNQQIMPGTAGAPPECIGLDLWTPVSTWGGAGKTADQWRDQAGGGAHGNGYSTFPEEMLTVLTACYLLPPFTNASGSVVAGLDHYHDTNLLYRIELLLDGCTYVYGADGRYNSNASGSGNGVWQGLTSTPRAAGHGYAGLTGRQGAWNISLEGVNVQALGWSIVSLLNDPVAMPLFTNYLAQKYDGNLIGSNSVLRAYGYEQMLCSNAVYLYNVTGGAESQNMFEELGMYSDAVALAKLQALYTNSAYIFSPATALNYAKQVMGVIPDNVGASGTGANPGTNLVSYGLTRGGLGEAHGSLSCGYDGNGYGQILPWLAPRFAWMAGNDANADAASVSNIVANANNTVNGFDRFLYPQDNATVDANRNLTADVYDFSEERYISYRDPENPQADDYELNFNGQFMASDPIGQMTNAMALRSAYLVALNGIVPSFNASGGNGQPGGCALNYLRDMAAYERTTRSLAGVNPASLTPLPGEPGQPDYAWADVQAGSVAVYNHGERLFLNANFQNFEWNNPQGFAGMEPSEYAFLHYTTTNIERAGLTVLPYNNANVQSDGNLSSSNLYSTYVVRYGNYLVVLNNSSNTTFNAKLPVGVGQAQDLISRTNFYTLGSMVAVTAGKAAIFWLAASNSLPYGAGGPTVATPAAASPNTVTGTTVNLSVLGASGGGESSLTYTWALAGNPPSLVTFSANGNNAAKNTTATFSSAGTYYFVVVIQDTSGYMTNSSVTVTVNQTASGLVVSPVSVTLLSGQSQQFSATATDQFGYPMQSLLNISWTLVSGVGGISSSALYLAPTNANGSATVRASSGAFTANATVSVAGPVGIFTGSLDIGSPTLVGSATFTNPVYTINGAGSDIWNSSDQFHFVCLPLGGDATITTRVATQQNTTSWSKAGVMFRNTLDANSAYAAVYVTPGNGVSYQYRSSAGAGAAVNSTTSGPAAPYWVRLTRSGNSFTAFSSSDGVTWTQVGTAQTIAMNQTIYVGLVNCSASAGTLNTSTFDNVSLTDSMIAPANVTAAGVNNAVILSWTGSAAATGYNVSRSTVSGGPYAIVGSPGTAFFIDPGLTNGTTYYYVESAFNFIRQTSNSIEVSATPTNQLLFNPGFELPGTGKIQNGFAAVPGWKDAGTVYDNSGVENTASHGGSWHAFCEGGDSGAYQSVNYYPIHTGDTFTLTWWAETSGGSGSSTQMVSLVSATTTNTAFASTKALASMTNTTPGSWTQYTVSYQATAADAGNYVGVYFNNLSPSGNWGGFDDFALSVISLPAAPTGLTATTISSSQINLSWTASSGATSYNVYRSAGSGGPYTQIASGIVATSYSNTGLSNGTTYYYVVTAVNTSGESSYSHEANAATIAAAPTGLVAITVSSGQINLSWTASGGASSYNVKRSTTSGGPYTTIATGVTSSTYIDTGLSSGTTYYYVVSAVNSGGESANSAESGATTIAAAPTGLGATAVSSSQINLSWTASGGASSYNVKRSTTSGGPYTTIATGVTGSMYNNTGLSSSTTYYYVVSAVNTGGESANSGQTSATTLGSPPASPTNLTATPGNAQVALAWLAPAGATSYNVKSATVNTGPYSTITNVTTTTYLNTGLTNGTGYYFVVSALNTNGESANSSQAAATPMGYTNQLTVVNPGFELPGTGKISTGFSTVTGWANAGSTYTDSGVEAKNPHSGSYRAYNKATDSGAYQIVNYSMQTGDQLVLTWWALTSGGTGTCTQTVRLVSAAATNAAYGSTSALVSVTNALPTNWTQYTLAYVATAEDAGKYVGIYFNNSAAGSGNGPWAGFDDFSLAAISASSVPSPWTTLDIGAVGLSGSALYTNGLYTVSGSGADIWGTADAFRYVSQPGSGDCSMVAKVASIQNTLGIGKAGVMIRETANANSTYAGMFITPGSGAKFEYRTSTGGSAANGNTTTGITPPYWVRLVRSGSTFTASMSADGATWTTNGSTTISMATNVLIGLPVTSNSTNVLCTGAFTNVIATP